MADNFLYVAAGEKTLASSLTSSATTIELADILSRAADALTMADFGTIGYATIEPNGSSMELISFTGISGTSLTGVTRGLGFESPYTTVAALQLPHSAGVTVVFSNSPQLYNKLAGKDNDETIAETWTFTNPNYPRMDSAVTAPTDDEQLITKKYADDLVIAGAADASTTVKGIVELATSAESQAGTDSGSTTASLVALPSDIAANVQNASHVFAADAEASDTYAITLSPAPSAYATGQLFCFTANTVNTGAATLNVNALGAIAIKKNHDQDLEDGDIESGSYVTVAYDGTVFQMLNQQATMPTTALLTEMATFFGTTNATGAEMETLTDGSDADSLHYHSPLPFSISCFRIADANSTTRTMVGYSDDPSAYTFVAAYHGTFSVALEMPYMTSVGVPIFEGANNQNNPSSGGFLRIGTDIWHSDGTNIYKDSTTITISGTGVGDDSALGHDVTNSYLLVLDTTTTIHRYSGIAGTTITYVDEITLDNAVDIDKGFVYDDVNAEYYCIDTGVIRRFNSSGTTQSTTTIGFDIEGLMGMCFVNNRLYLVSVPDKTNDAVSSTLGSTIITFYPTSLTR